MRASGDIQRTRLAHERTYLAWWRAGIASVAAGFAIGRIVPEVLGGTAWPYVAVGAALGAAGLLAFVFGHLHYRELDAALAEDREPRTARAVLVALAAIGVAVGIVSILLIVLAP
jgi:uncharacterized membrane protein YidH (DUF202 family)